MARQEKKPGQWSYLDAPVLDALDLASIAVAQMLDTPYLVGSCLTRPDYRDVDIRVILFDERYDELFPGGPQRDPLRHLIQVAITDRYVQETGLRIDFQIQRMTQANERYPDGHRHPLGMYSTPHRGEMSDHRVLDHEFLPVDGHPDDDECTYRNDGTDLTYCGRQAEEHEL